MATIVKMCDERDRQVKHMQQEVINKFREKLKMSFRINSNQESDVCSGTADGKNGKFLAIFFYKEIFMDTALGWFQASVRNTHKISVRFGILKGLSRGKFWYFVA